MQRRFFKLGVLMGSVLLIASILLTGCNGEASGVELFTLNCAGCHGTAGKGSLAKALSDPAYLATHDDEMITRLTSQGIPNTGMRAFSKANGGPLTDEQITAIVKYLRSIPSAN